MGGYSKKIAVIKGLKEGFSADGGALSGLVKAETYAGFLKVEVSLINFAPLTEGRYAFGLTDGLATVVFDALNYEGEADFNLANGFAFLVCFCKDGCAPVASAACGELACALPDLKEEMCRREAAAKKGGAKGGAAATEYEDDAIAEVNYYEYNTDEDGGAVRENESQEEEGRDRGQDEAAVRPVQAQDGEPADPELAKGNYYTRMSQTIESIFSSYPEESVLQGAIEGSRWAKIGYGDGKYYAFGVLKVEGAPRYICYGVPATDPNNPPPSLKGSASFLPVKSGGAAGYWVIYQDALTGVSIKIESV